MKTGRWIVLVAAVFCGPAEARDEVTWLAPMAGAPEKRSALVVGNGNVRPPRASRHRYDRRDHAFGPRLSGGWD